MGGALGRQCERWRFAFEEAVRSRSYACRGQASEGILIESDAPCVAEVESGRPEFVTWAVQSGFGEVPSEALVPTERKVCWPRKLNYCEYRGCGLAPDCAPSASRGG